MRPSAAGDAGVSLSWIESESGCIEGDVFHHVVLATHGDDVLPLLAKQPTQIDAKSSTERAIKSSSYSQYVSKKEMEVFSAFQTTENVCYLHSDLSLMPRRRATWTAWNYLTHSAPSKLSNPAGVSLTYCMNILQHLPESQLGPVLVTMNPQHAPDPALTQGKFIYRHPLYTVEAVRAQKRLDSLQNTRGVSYCGAWTKYGFHEDGFSSGLKVAIDHLGAELPFEFVDSTYSRGHKPVLGWKDYVVRMIIMLTMLWFPVIEFFLGLPVVRTVVPLTEAIGSRVLDVAESVGLLKDPVVKMKVG
jgi:predicted NAD/FAD-binding protein